MGAGRICTLRCSAAKRNRTPQSYLSATTSNPRSSPQSQNRPEGCHEHRARVAAASVNRCRLEALLLSLRESSGLSLGDDAVYGVAVSRFASLL
jgi:hypothetical protein